MRGIASHPGPLVFSRPTILKYAIFVPHVRESYFLLSVLRSKEAGSTSALFLHANVEGESTNDWFVSRWEIPPSDFPPGVPTYSGHYHSTHIVVGEVGGRGGRGEGEGEPPTSAAALAWMLLVR